MNKEPFPDRICAEEMNAIRSVQEEMNMPNGSPSRYQLLRKIGSGTYGTVFRAIDRQTNDLVAVKQPETFGHQGLSAAMIREASLLKLLSSQQHDNIIALKDIFLRRNKIFLVFHLYQCNLKKVMSGIVKSGSASMDRSMLKSFMRQILSALEFCHKQRILHRDLKPDNILLDGSKKSLVIADFGMARQFGKQNPSEECVSLWYRAPEIMLGDISSSASLDIWSAGIIMVEMINLKTFMSKCETEKDCLQKIFEHLGIPNEVVWPGISSLNGYSSLTSFARKLPREDAPFILIPDACPRAADLVGCLLQLCPARRLTASEALEEHEFFSSEPCAAPKPRDLGPEPCYDTEPWSSQSDTEYQLTTSASQKNSPHSFEGPSIQSVNDSFKSPSNLKRCRKMTDTDVDWDDIDVRDSSSLPSKKRKVLNARLARQDVTSAYFPAENS